MQKTIIKHNRLYAADYKRTDCCIVEQCSYSYGIEFFTYASDIAFTSSTTVAVFKVKPRHN